MSLATAAQPRRRWSPEGFMAFWAKPDPLLLPGIFDVITNDIVGYWPRPIGTVRDPEPYMKVIAALLEECPDFSLKVPEHASTGDFHFIRWVATGTGPEGRFEFTGCDRVRTRDGLVCENYVFCDHPFFVRVAARL
ncbi:MAG: nuclear transport factor 2 family protein [Parvibaculum sp.]|uniref:nuclear transport factor 2 family protein n=1 Tax=Parvibaculum sp. TaxID=2024848 RepID=UPI0034A09738